MFKKLVVSVLLVTPLIPTFNTSPIHAATTETQQAASIDLSYLKKNLVGGMTKSQIKNVLGTDYTEGINHLNNHESWTFLIGKAQGYEFTSPNEDAVDEEGIKQGKLKYHVSISFDQDVLESVIIFYLGSQGEVSQYYKDYSAYSKNKGNKASKSNSKFIDFGDRGNQVKEVQKQLISKGFSLPRYGSDGVFGEETDKAVKAFQKQQGILVDGIVGPVTLQKLGISSNGSVKSVGYPGYLIKMGSTGNHVKNIQKEIGVKVDGIFGPKTEAAVKSYQKQQGLKVDGLVGPKTWNNMF